MDQLGYNSDKRTIRPSFVLNQSLVTTFEGSVSWGDYDNDGDLDTAITGREDNSYVQNNNNQKGTSSSVPTSGLSSRGGGASPASDLT